MIIFEPVFEGMTKAQFQVLNEQYAREDAERAAYNAGYERLFKARRIAKEATGEEWGKAYFDRVKIEKDRLDREATIKR